MDLHLFGRDGVDEARNDLIPDDIPAVFTDHQPTVRARKGKEVRQIYRNYRKLLTGESSEGKHIFYILMAARNSGQVSSCSYSPWAGPSFSSLWWSAPEVVVVGSLWDFSDLWEF